MRHQRVNSVDIAVYDCGSIVQFTPLNSNAKNWIDENLAVEDWQWMGGALCLDRRMAPAVIDAIWDAGMRIG